MHISMSHIQGLAQVELYSVSHDMLPKAISCTVHSMFNKDGLPYLTMLWQLAQHQVEW